MEHVDVVISGAGLAGMVAAHGFARQGRSVIVLDPTTIAETAQHDGADLRATAYLNKSVDLLEQLGLWPALAPHATDLAALQILDTYGHPPKVTETRTFLPDDLDQTRFGVNLINWRTRAQFVERCSEAHIDLRLGVGLVDIVMRERENIVRLSDGSFISTRLVVGADGRNSQVARVSGINMSTTRYGQKALTFAVTHEKPHKNTSTEIYGAGGAFTTVPLPDYNNQPASSIVWMNDGPKAQQLYHTDSEVFSQQTSERSTHVYGEMKLQGKRQIWPVISQRANSLTAPRVVLIAEAAHVMPPIGAQGLNTSLADIACILEVTHGARDPGANNILQTYSHKRRRDILQRAIAIEWFNRICKSHIEPVQTARTMGLRLVHDIAPMRRAIMRIGSGAVKNPVERRF